MQRFCKLAAIMLSTVLLVSRSPARAAGDDGTRLASSVARAAAGVVSFRMTLGGMQNLRSSMIVVRPDRVSSNMAFGPMTTETIVVGATSYTRINGGQWLVSKMQNVSEVAERWNAAFEKQTTYTLLPDREDAGVTYGAFSTTTDSSSVMGAPAGAPAAPVTMQCTYDKSTYFLHVRTLEPPGVPFPMTVTYSAWNDPQNVVDVPADAPADK